MLDLDTVRAVSFDCYGTLVDRDGAVRDFVVSAHQLHWEIGPAIDDWMARWRRAERRMREGAWRPCGEILAESFVDTMHSFSLGALADGAPGVARSIAEWRPFPDAVAALRRIARRRRLALLADADRAAVSQTLGHLLAPFGAVVTAEDVGAYGPARVAFERLVRDLGVKPEAVLHVAATDDVDGDAGLRAARDAGLRTARLRRADLGPSGGADLEVASLAALADRLGG